MSKKSKELLALGLFAAVGFGVYDISRAFRSPQTATFPTYDVIFPGLGINSPDRMYDKDPSYIRSGWNSFASVASNLGFDLPSIPANNLVTVLEYKAEKIKLNHLTSPTGKFRYTPASKEDNDRFNEYIADSQKMLEEKF